MRLMKPLAALTIFAFMMVVGCALAGDPKKTISEERTLVWVDEAGFYLLPAAVRTYAPCGETPILRSPLSYDHLSVISAITPQGRLLVQMQEEAYTGEAVVGFLKHLEVDRGNHIRTRNQRLAAVHCLSSTSLREHLKCCSSASA